MDWVNAVVQGILLGGFYALFATGLSLVFGVMRIVNLAHGDLSVLAAFVAVLLADHAGINPFVSLLIVVPVMAVGASSCSRRCCNFTLDSDAGAAARHLRAVDRHPERAAAGLLGQLAGARTSARSRPTASSITSQISVGWLPLITLLAAVLLLVGLQLVVRHTGLGRALRATSDDQRAAQLMGIDNRRLYAVAMAISLATVAVAGVFLAIRTSFTPTPGPLRLIFAFEAVIIGGLGSLWGTLLGGIVLGVAQAVGAQISPGWGVLAGHLVFLAVLALRPSGLLGRTAAGMSAPTPPARRAG